MEKIILDIGSGNVKGYSVSETGEIKSIYIKNIIFKKNFSKQNGISEIDKEELINAIKELQSNNKGVSIHAYATSIFRMLNLEQKEKLKADILHSTGVDINVITQQQEEIYMAKSVGNICELEEPYLVCCVGGSSTEMIVMKNGVIIEQLTEEFATGDMLKAFPELENDRANIDVNVLRKYVTDNLKNLPKNKCKYAIFTGFHLTYNTIAESKMNENTFFNRKEIPYYITTKQFVKNSEDAIKNISLNELRERYPQNPKFMNGTRGANIIVSTILEHIGAEYYFPSDLNMIHGIVSELKEKKAHEEQDFR